MRYEIPAGDVAFFLRFLREALCLRSCMSTITGNGDQCDCGRLKLIMELAE